MPEHNMERRLGLGQATAINMIDMVSIGPFITLPMVIGMMNGAYFLYAWVAGAVLSFVDAMIWSELGAAFPKAGGSYNFLKEAYGKDGAGQVHELFVCMANHDPGTACYCFRGYRLCILFHLLSTVGRLAGEINKRCGSCIYCCLAVP